MCANVKYEKHQLSNKKKNIKIKIIQKYNRIGNLLDSGNSSSHVGSSGSNLIISNLILQINSEHSIMETRARDDARNFGWRTFVEAYMQ